MKLVRRLQGACHGSSKLFAWPDWWAAVVELIGGCAVAAVLGTRVTALCTG